MTTSPVTSITFLAEQLRSGERPLLQFIDQLEAYFNLHEPEVFAFVPEPNRFDRLRSDAEQLLKKYPDPAQRPLLFGVPVGVKDIFHVAGFETRAGSQLPVEILQGEESTAVSQLKTAGVLILGKTVTTEFAYFAPGPTKNPHNPNHTPGGSSSGSAAAVAAGLVPLAFGTQTIGSINRPGAFCGTFGYKPSYDRISRQGVIPLSQSVDHIGLFGTDLAGMTMAASVIVENWTPVSASRKPVFGVPEGPYLDHATGEGRTHFRQTCKRLHQAGYSVNSVLAMPDFEKIKSRHQLIVAAEAARFHADWFEQFGQKYHHKTAELIQTGLQVSDRQLSLALKGRERLRRSLTQLMTRRGIDIWLSPPAPGTAPLGLESTGDPVMNLPWTHAGLPSINLPAGVGANGLPLGLQLTGRWYEDEALFEWGNDIASILSP